MKTPIPDRRKRVESICAAINQAVEGLPAEERTSDIVELVETALRLEIEGFSVRVTLQYPLVN